MTNEALEAAAKLAPISEIAAKLGLGEGDFEPYGKLKAKIILKNATSDSAKNPAALQPRPAPKGHLILVTATNPTPLGEGKTTVSVALADALRYIGKNACAALREPSLGPVFGIKGGATGGGCAQVAPSEEINLHFTGDFHAITSANNLICAMIDNHLHHGNELGIDPQKVFFRRCMDMSDRSLRQIKIGLEKSCKAQRDDGFIITAASEIMAILCLATDFEDLKKRLGEIIVAKNQNGELVKASELGVVGAAARLLKDAIKPNLVQTLQNTPVLIHGGPFANIAHGCNSVIATNTALSCADFVVTEAGFGAELGAQKFLDIKCKIAGIAPSAVVLVSTIRALKYNGGVDKTEVLKPNLAALKLGSINLRAHIQNLQKMGQSVVVALNVFENDIKEELDFIISVCEEMGVAISLCEGFLKGNEGTKDLAQKVVRVCEKATPKINFTYDDDDDILIKIEKIATKIYGADGVRLSEAAKGQLDEIRRLNLAKMPVCIAKTQYSFSSDAKLLGRPSGFIFEVSSLEVRGGAGFIVAVSGATLLMPGLPKTPAAMSM